MAARSPQDWSKVPQHPFVRAPRRIARLRRAARRELPPLDLRTPSGRKSLPY